jgi:hypothetical protein
MPHPSHSSWFDHPNNNIGWEVQISYMSDDRNIATPHIQITEWVTIPAGGGVSGAGSGTSTQQTENMQLFAWRTKAFMIGILSKRIYLILTMDRLLACREQ